MSFLNLVKGDENNLQGKVIVYSKLTHISNGCKHCEDESCPIPQGYEPIFSLYGSIDKEDFIRNTDPPKELFNDLDDKIDSGCNFGAAKKDSEFFYGGTILIETEKEILSRPVDVVNVREYTQPTLCQNAVKAGMQLYLINFLEQSSKKQHNPKKINSSITTYRDFKGGEAIRGFIANQYMLPMLKAKERGNFDTLKTLKEDFMRFSEGSLFSDDVMALYKYLEESNEASPSHILTNQSHVYLDRIVAKHLLKEAVAEERFEDATKLKNRIAKLAQQ